MNFFDALNQYRQPGSPPNPALIKYKSRMSSSETDPQKLKDELDKVRNLSSNDYVEISGKYYQVAYYENALRAALGEGPEIPDDPKAYSIPEYLDVTSQSGVGLTISKSIKDDTDITDLASLEAIKIDAQKNIELIDDYILGLVTGRDFKEFSLNRTNNMFIKIADTPSEKEVIEPVREYFNELYEDSEGSPNVGDLYVEPEKHRGELSTEVDNKKSVYVPKFKKV